MLLQTIEALRQERQLNQELSAVMQKRIEDLAIRASDIAAGAEALRIELDLLAGDVREELAVRDKALDGLIGNQ